jgi:hypothetical protein
MQLIMQDTVRVPSLNSDDAIWMQYSSSAEDVSRCCRKSVGLFGGLCGGELMPLYVIVGGLTQLNITACASSTGLSCRKSSLAAHSDMSKTMRRLTQLD